jgi:hypothetical protein
MLDLMPFSDSLMDLFGEGLIWNDKKDFGKFSFLFLDRRTQIWMLDKEE